MSAEHTTPGSGRVFFVGAGPGDPGLLTLRGAELLAGADLVLYDRLASRCQPNVPGKAVWECVEQLPGCHPDRIGTIVRRMIAAANAGRTVVRLKGGDPMVFGRSAEEWQPLLDAGIRFAVVPGVTSALAAAAGGLVTLTDRRSSSAVAFVTGHENPDKPGSMIDWELLARFPGTLVFYMGVARLGHVVDRLSRHGKPPDTPVAVIANASFPEESRLETTLGTVVEQTRLRGIGAPAITIVGEVVRGAAKRAVQAGGALSGRVVLTTRPAGQEQPLASILSGRGAVVLNLPVLGIGPAPDLAALDAAIDCARGQDWIAFFSANGVRSWFDRLDARGLDSRVFGGARIAAIGKETARHLRACGIRADLVPEDERSEGLEVVLADQVRGKRVLLVRADHGREHLEKALRGLAKVECVAAYAQQERNVTGTPGGQRLVSGGYDALLATSGRAFQGVLRHLDEAGKAFLRQGKAKILALGAVTADAIRQAGFPVAGVSAGANPEAMAEAVEKALSEG